MFAQQQQTAKKESQRKEFTDKIAKELDMFSVTLNKNHWSNALAIKENMSNSGMEDQAVRVHTSEVYKKSFTFPQIAHNDYAVEQFETLNIAE